MNTSDSSFTSSSSTSQKSVDGLMRFSVNKGLIEKSENQEIDSIQRVTVYDHNVFEAGVIEQANDALIKHKTVQIKAVKERLSALDDDIKFAQNELEKMEQLLDNLLSEIPNEGSTNRLENRKIRSLELEIETKMKHIDTLSSRKTALITKLSTLEKTFPNNSTPETEKSESLQATSSTKSLPIMDIKPPRKQSIINLPNEKNRKNNVKELNKLAKVKHNDDADIKAFQERLRRQRRIDLLEKQLAKEHEIQSIDPEDGKLDGGFCVPGSIWSRLFDYQKRGVSWLWNLHQKGCGGIVGDEMGLGKTIQVIALLAGLHYSKIEDQSHRLYLSASSSNSEIQQDFVGLGPSLIVCPATVLNQWMSEFHSWWPPIRVAILHSTGSGYGKPNKLIQTISNNPGSVLLTTYATLVTYRDVLTSRNWSYIILDEGHKIKNPEAEATLAVKHFSTPHRLILSGSPIQNNLRELWSLFDFVCPGRLGPLPEFMQQFSIPITQGGYATASPLQVEAAYQCACTLRDLLKPYLIRRLKADVQIQLPSKSEQVLFCRLTEYQRKLYREYLESQTCKDLLNGKGNIFPSLILLRNLCNHPDLATGGPRDSCFLNEEYEVDKQGIENVCLSYSWSRFGCPRRSSKMLVVASLLKNWFDQGHKVLLFSQGRRMLTLLERLVQLMKLPYLRMDGTTPISQRHELIRRFNYRKTNNTEHASSDPCDIFVFLLTTRVGGLGVNLTSANRVLIYDPDWNPTTDLQARERAWRIGQLRDVIVYRLLTSGTIEEKIYQRQIFKQFLTNRILKNPRQQRFFKTNDLQELLSFEGSDTDMQDNCETTLYLQSEGMGHTVTDNYSSSSSTTTTPSNRFDRLAQKQKDKSSQQKKHCDLDREDSSSDGDDDDDDANADEDDTMEANQEKSTKRRKITDDSVKCSSSENTDPQDERRIQLRKLAKEISRRISEGCLDKNDPVEFTSPDNNNNNNNNNRQTKQKSSSRHYKRKNKNINTGLEKDDDFIRTVLTGASSSSSYGNETDSNLLTASLAKKRSVVDQDIREEANRIANEALKNIQRFYKPSRTKSEESTEKNKENVRKANHKESLKKSHSNHLSSTDKSSKLKEIKSHNSSPFLSHITQIVQHDQLLDEMTNPNHIDVSFSQIEANRLASDAIKALQEEVINWQRQQSNRSSSSTQNTEHKVTYPFGQAKNRFLWNPNESTSSSYLQLLQLSGESEDTNEKWHYENSARSHVRFSSELLFSLIRLRKISRQCHAYNSTDQKSVNAMLNQSMQRLCAEIIRILSTSPCVTSEYLTVRFANILNKNNNNDNSEDCKKGLQQNGMNSVSNRTATITAQHFRALLKQLAVRHRAKKQNHPSDKPSRGRLDDIWILRDKFRPVASYLFLHLASVERLDQCATIDITTTSTSTSSSSSSRSNSYTNIFQQMYQ
ncbi:unnamed protein product [Trichobilharzia szidati]|nr:unnamed protein product [Trichobilharzia szidati]